ncbi:MAG: hypothetical protein Q9166_000579 [cf. Caloplaca sp. 2 TL-2023]
MSSPFPGRYDVPSNRAAASSPRLAPREPQAPPQSQEGVSIRSMRLLYTFDHENKTNCLARWPQNIDIRTAFLDENTQIGVIELKTCIQAIVAASPELVAKLGQDYTVYAYDYSEYDTPLVGQGMLSWVLASSSSTPAAPAHQSKTIVTGRVCKNIMGLFSSNTQETLEVKLRLVPVPTCLQSEYIESMKSYRDLSRVMPEGFDAQTWTNFLQANPGILQLAGQTRVSSPATAMGQQNGVGIEHVQRLMHQSHASMDQSDQNPPPQSDNYSAAEAIEQLPRPLSQASSVRSAVPPKRGRGRPPKAVSELSEKSRSRRKPQPPRRGSFDVGYGSNDDQQEEGPGRKRAKVTKAEYPGSSGFAKQPELRVAASTAASVRIHQPTAVRPNTRAASSLEGPPREPTPVAGPSHPNSRPLLHARKSNLRCEPLVVEEPPYESPYPPSDVGKVAESEINSPEGSRAESSNTPADFASSPPAYPGSMTALSSPRLPNLPQEVDSGFMSGTIDDLFEDESRPPNDEDLDVVSQYMKRQDLHLPPAARTTVSQDSGVVLQSEQTQQPFLPDKQANGHDQKPDMATPDRSKLNRTASSGNLAPPSTFNSDTARPSLLHRSQTWAGHRDDHPCSDTVMISEANGNTSRVRSRKGSESGSGAKRRKQIQSKLAESVANGEMPPFCENCGAIETPTWRKAWIKVHSGTPENVVLSDEDGGVMAWQSLQKDANGQVCLFRVIKRTLLPTDKGFTESLLCNPCGIWLHTRKCMRPEEAWDKPQGSDGGGGPRKRSSQSKQGKSGSLPHQPTDGAASGGRASFSDASSPADTSEQTQQSRQAQLSAPTRPRASSVQLGGSKPVYPRLDKSTAAAALQRAIQSSPVQCRSVQNTAIAGKDLTPKPTRRILFPSPTQSNQRRAVQGKVADSANFNAASPTYTTSQNLDPADKENLPPQQEEEDHQDVDDQAPPRSATPTPSSRSREMSFKTPNRSVTPDRVHPTTGDFFSSAAKALLRPQITPRRPRPDASQPLSEVSPFTAQVNEILSDANVVSPPGSNFDFPNLPSLNNTPGRMLRQDFDFSIFDPQDLLGTDVPMASSPPLEGWFGVYEDPAERDGNFWSDYPFPASSPPASVKSNSTPPKLSVDARGHAMVDISPLAKSG